MLFTLAGFSGLAQSTGDLVDHDVDVFVQDAADIFSRPADFDAGDWLHVGIILGSVAAIYTVDDDVQAWSQGWRTPEWDSWLQVGDWYGNGQYNTLFGAGMYIGGLAADDDWSRVTGRMLLQSQVYSAALTQLIKTAIGRARPDEGKGKDSFYPFTLSMRNHSHPSGHTTSAFAFSSTLSRRVGSLPLSVLLYSLSAASLLQRIEGNRHWLSDTIMGAVLGTVIGLAVVQAEEHREQLLNEQLPISAGFSPHRPLYDITIQF